MNLIVDVGNTFIKLAVFEGFKLIYKKSFKLLDFKTAYEFFKKKFPDLDSAIISSVARLPKSDQNLISSDFKTLILSANTILPFVNLYKTPKTLGVDRLALVSAASHQFPKKNVLVIDAGTCVTYDFINTNNAYLGGAISPGIRMRYKSLNALTAKLPLLETTEIKNYIGDTTETAIHSGVINGIVKEIDGVITEYKENHSDLTVILTGGDAIFLSNQLKNSIFANSNFLLEGLNFILLYNSK